MLFKVYKDSDFTEVTVVTAYTGGVFHGKTFVFGGDPSHNTWKVQLGADELNDDDAEVEFITQKQANDLIKLLTAVVE